MATNAVQGQLLTALASPSNFFVPFANPNPVPPISPGPSGVPANLWSNIVSGDFNRDGNLDIAYSLTGLPLPAPSAGAGPGLYVQYGNGDGTFQNPVAVTGTAGADPLYGESTVGDFNGDGKAKRSPTSERPTITPCSARQAGASMRGRTGGNQRQLQPGCGGLLQNRTCRSAGFDLPARYGFVPYKNAQDGTGKNFALMAPLPGQPATVSQHAVLLTDVDGDGHGDLVAVYYNANFNPVGAGPVAPNRLLYIWWGNETVPSEQRRWF